MGKRIDALLGRGLKTAKLKATANLAISRLAVLKNQRQVRCSIARSDVVQLLNLRQHHRALLRVEQVMKEQNMLDVFGIVEGYCYLLTERVNQLEHEKVCPDELKEAISGLIYAATRCGEFPELQELRAIFSAKFGKEFTARAVELRNNCGVNPKMIQKLSTRMPSHEDRLKVLKEIAKENDIVVQIDESSDHENEATKVESKEEHREKMEVKYKDVGDAAQAAFESAAYAAAAARAAVELSRYSQSSTATTRGSSSHHHYFHTRKAYSDTSSTEEDGDVDVEGGGFGFGFDDEIIQAPKAEKEDKEYINYLNEDRTRPISVRTKPKYR